MSSLPGGLVNKGWHGRGPPWWCNYDLFHLISLLFLLPLHLFDIPPRGSYTHLWAVLLTKGLPNPQAGTHGQPPLPRKLGTPVGSQNGRDAETIPSRLKQKMGRPFRCQTSGSTRAANYPPTVSVDTQNEGVVVLALPFMRES